MSAIAAVPAAPSRRRVLADVIARPSSRARAFAVDAALVLAGVTGLEAGVMHVAQGDSWTRGPLQKTRGYSDEEWEAAVAGLVGREWLTPDSTFTEAGAAARAEVERRTDELSLPAYEHLGEDGCARLRELARPLRHAVLEGGGIGIA